MRTKAEVMKDLGRVRRRKITIQKKVTEKNEYGDVTTTWQDWKAVWAERESLWGRDYFAALAVGEQETVEFVVRHVGFLDELKTDTHRLVFEGGIYDLKQVDYLKDDDLWLKLRAVRQG
jgi:SPP1 family predicted phage head-tail adaptor